MNVKKILLGFIFLLISCGLFSSDNDTIDDIFSKISNNTEQTSENTSPTFFTKTDIDEILTIILSIIAAVGTIFTVISIKQETNQQAINKDFQEKILTDLVRHFYRNKVCVCATMWKLKEMGFDDYYPSEEHLLKLKVLPEDLRIEKFSNTPFFYDDLHELELKLRNYNIEVDVTLEHLKKSEIGEDVKYRDLQVLEFKSQYLTKEIFQLMKKLKFQIAYKVEAQDWDLTMKNRFNKIKKNEIRLPIKEPSVKHYLCEISKRFNEENPLYADIENIPKRNGDKYTYYDNVILMSDELNKDICGEYPKINLIKF